MSLSEPVGVLLIEDDADVRASVEKDLRREGYRFVAAESLDEAREILQHCESTVDIVFVNSRLFGESADDWMRVLEADAPHTDIVVIADYSAFENAMAALRSGAEDYLISPVHPDALHAALLRITQRRRLEHQLWQEHQFCEQVLRTAEATVAVLDPQGRVVRMNSFLARLLGLETETAPGTDWFQKFACGNERGKLRDLFRQALDQKVSRRIVATLKTSGGVNRKIRWSHTPLLDESGEVTAVLAIGVDVTDLIALHEEKQRAGRLVALGQSVVAFSHESRNVLQRIQARVELLELELADLPEAKRDVNLIAAATRDLWSLLEEVRIFATPLTLDLVKANLSKVWREAWQRVAPSTAGREAHLIEETDACDLSLEADPRRLEQVFRNLFENSLAAAPDPVAITIRCRESDDPSFVELDLQDNGPGLDTEQRQNIFTPFYTTKDQGTGLGMAIAKRIVEAHGGSISVGNCNGSGARFFIKLPQKAPVPC